MSQAEEIAEWLRNYHCSDENCIKSNCILLRGLAEQVEEIWL